VLIIFLVAELDGFGQSHLPMRSIQVNHVAKAKPYAVFSSIRKRHLQRQLHQYQSLHI
jgi:hypothetical protein